MIDQSPLAREKRREYMAEWRLTDAGRKNTAAFIEKRSNLRRGIAEAKAAASNSGLVQQALSSWGGS